MNILFPISSLQRFDSSINLEKLKNKTICLNPSCQASRLFQRNNHNQSQMVKVNHKSCSGWTFSLEKFCDSTLIMRTNDEKLFNLDYLKNPIQSIYKCELIGKNMWEKNIEAWLQKTLKKIQNEVKNIYFNAKKLIKAHFDENQQIFNKIVHIILIASQEENQKLNQKYKLELQSHLIKIQHKGPLLIFNENLLQKQLQKIVCDVDKMKKCFLSSELRSDKIERIGLQDKKNQISKYSTLGVMQICEKIQQIENIFKQSVKIFDGNKEAQAYCFKCPQKMISAAQNIKLRKQQCRQKILNHLCTKHISDLLIKLSTNIAIKLTLQDLAQEIQNKNIQRILIIDKENMKINTDFLRSSQKNYIIEVVSKNSEHLAKGKYLVAESKGKDAADILIIITMFELGKLGIKDITLFTSDHYGETLKPIFASLGINIKTVNKQEQMNSLIDY